MSLKQNLKALNLAIKGLQNITMNNYCDHAQYSEGKVVPGCSDYFGNNSNDWCRSCKARFYLEKIKILIESNEITFTDPTVLG